MYSLDSHITIQVIVSNLDLSLAATYFECEEAALKKNLASNAKHVLDLMNQHEFNPRSGKKILSIGCGLAEELIALLAYYQRDTFIYTGIDIGGDYILLCKHMFKNFENISFLHENAAELVTKGHHADGYDIVILRHPHFLFEDNSQFSDFKKIAQIVIPNLHKIRPISLFCTFYEEIEL